MFAFGHGLSYTSFEYSDLEVGPESRTTSSPLDVAVTVTNSGDRGGEDVVQLYLHDPVARSARPPKQQRGFQRLALGPG